jgi:putative membrane protein
MRYMISSLITSVLAFLAASYLLPGFHVAGLWSAVLGAVLLGLANALIRPLIILFTLPVTVLTLGLFLLVVNGLVLYLVVWLVPGIAVANFMWAIIAALVITAINAALGAILG